MTRLRYRLDLRQTGSRWMEVTCEAARGLWPVGEEPGFWFPVWTPGSYLVREYARHLGRLRAEDAVTGTELEPRQTAKNRWNLEGAGEVGTVRLHYRVHAHELSVRTADLTEDHAYWNGACVFLWPRGVRREPVEIEILLPVGWDLATELTGERDGDLHRLTAEGIDELIDAPCLAGDLRRVPFEVAGRPHEMVFDGLGPVAPPEQLTRDVSRVVEEAAAVFDAGLPYDRYTFLSLHTDRGGGGLEHTHSSTLLAPRTTFRNAKTYRSYLGLVAHELFHVWNVKRMRPAELWEYDYERENPTDLLWVAEGFTAYYDEHLCLRAGVHDVESYLEGLAGVIESLWNNPGRFEMSLAASSREAWVRLYRPDENTRNSSQNYYNNGSLVALVLDLTIRSATGGARSLDDAMRLLWRSTWEEGRGYTRADVDAAVSEAAGKDLAPLIAGMVDGPFDPDLGSLLADFGVRLERTGSGAAWLGVTFKKGSTVLGVVQAGSPADRARLAPGDEILALDGLRVTGEDWEKIAEAVARPGQPLRLTLVRRGILLERTVTPAARPGKVTLAVDPEAGSEAVTLRQGWLGR